MYKGKNIASIVSSSISGILGIIILVLSKSFIFNTIGIALVLAAIIGASNYYRYSIILEKDEMKINGLFKKKRIGYGDIIKLFTVQAGATYITYIVDRLKAGDKYYIRGTYPLETIDKLKDAQFNDLSSLVTVNSYTFGKYRQLLLELSSKLKKDCCIDQATWKVINSEKNSISAAQDRK
jgi:hypothetical protein